ncbi:arylsulfatase A-like enzyme [Bradyrhizobium sp. i1.3.6]
MARAKNVLWIMCDQLRYDYLGCTGHPTLKTPNIDAMAKRGVLFSKAYVQSPICGPSRMSFYTGRYMRSHGSHWNGWPLRVGEPTLGDHLKKIGVRNVLVGKTHMAPDLEGMKALGIPPESMIGVHVAECGFEPYERDDGLHPTGRPRPKYDEYLRSQGFEATKIPGSIGRIPAKLATAPCRTAGSWCMPTRPRACRTSTLRRPT